MAASRGQRRAPGRRPPKAPDRSGTLFLVLAAGLVLVAARLVWVQAVSAGTYAEQAADQRLRDIELSPRRGAIFDREGVPLAVTSPAKTIYANPYQVEDKAGTASRIASVLGGDAAAYQDKLSKDAGFVYIGRKVDADRARTLEEMKLPGLGFIEDSRRTYPSGDLACQVLGFVGVDDKGLAGIEQQYDALLAGTPGRILAERDPQGRLIPGGVQHYENAVDGEDVVLTIDKDIQYLAQNELAAAVKKWSAKSGSVVVMDPRNGEILAMASVPTFDPNAYGKADSTAYRNRPVCDVYEPGSTIKSFTAAAVIDKGLFTPDSKFNLPSTLKVGGSTIHESHGRGAVNWSLTQIVTNSSNVGAVRLGQALGRDDLYHYFTRFGLTEKTGIDFPGEVRGHLPPPGQWSGNSIGNIPFGQGISVTPLQLTRSMAALANGGELVTPHLLLSVPDDDSIAAKTKRERAVAATTCAQMADVLAAVITEGTGEGAAVPGYTVAGKTGTAQKVRADGRGYKGGGYVGSFSGYLPAEDPRLVIVVTLDEPTGAIYGGVVAAPVFSKVAQFAVTHLKIPPSSAASGAVETTAAAAGGRP